MQPLINPETVLGELRERYAAISSYQDTGVVLSQVADEEFVSETKFSTFFARPNRFRFDWLRHHPYPPLKHITSRHRIWQNPSGVFYWNQDDHDPESFSDVSFAIAGAKGVSENASYTVPSMLFGVDPVFASDHLTVQTITDGETEGIPCRCILANDSRKRSYSLYIGRDDLLLHRVSSSVMDDWSSDEIHRDIRIDQAISEDVFVRNPED